MENVHSEPFFERDDGAVAAHVISNNDNNTVSVVPTARQSVEGLDNPSTAIKASQPLNAFGQTTSSPRENVVETVVNVPEHDVIGPFSLDRTVPFSVPAASSSVVPTVRIVKTVLITNVINNKFGEIVTIVYNQHYMSDGSVKTEQNTQSISGILTPEIGVNYEDYYLHDSIPQGWNILNIFFPKIPHKEPEVEDLTDKFNSFGINPYKQLPALKDQFPIKIPRTDSVESQVQPEEGLDSDAQEAEEEYSDSEEEYMYPLCPICQDDTLELETDGEHFKCSRCFAFLPEDFDEEEIRNMASNRGVKLQPIQIEAPASSTQD